MKRLGITLISVLAIVMAGLLSSCNKDDEPKSGNDDNKTDCGCRGNYFDCRCGSQCGCLICDPLT